MSYCKNFISRNRTYFEACLKEADDKRFLVLGFATGTVLESFEELIKNEDEKLLPYCLYLIQFGQGVTEDKTFSMSAFEEILPNMETCMQLPIMSYIYAYCLNRDGDLKKSEEIIESLVQRKFSPALVTHGDLSWMHNEFENAKNYYLSARNAGHFIGKVKMLKLFGRGPKVFSRMLVILKMWKDTFTKNYTADRYLYLNFYGLKTH